jgi:hypothetical protein
MLDELEERYKFPSRITRGLITKSYYIEGWYYYLSKNVVTE